ncbi:tubulin-like protein [Vibrio phage BONAISHI]|nr:tubulin-like protein [Vibrio phage BONAISHI]
MNKEPLIQIYGCGGCGTNIVQNKLEVPRHAQYGKTSVVAIDTSDANYDADKGVPFYRIPGTEGMGRKRGFALDVAEDKIDDILKRHKPGSMNVIIASAGGGSGSVIGLLLAKEFMRRSIPFVVQLVASSTSQLDAQNSHGTMLSFQKAVNETGKVLPVMYYENIDGSSQRDGDGNRDQVDAVLVKDLLTLIFTCSEQHKALDRQDVTNWLDYPSVTKIEPKLVEVKVFRHGEEITDLAKFLDNQVISTISLLHETSHSTPAIHQAYEKTGYMNDDAKDIEQNLTWTVSSVHITSYASGLKTSVEEHKRVASELNAVSGLNLDDEDEDIL